jgi:hypothetical protein
MRASPDVGLIRIARPGITGHNANVTGSHADPDEKDQQSRSVPTNRTGGIDPKATSALLGAGK